MKKSVLLAAGVCLLSSMAAFADPVTSVNAVGVTRVNLPAGFSMIAVPFNAVGGQGLTLDQLFGTNLPDSTYVFTFVAGSGYVNYQYIDGMGWLNDNSEPSGDSKILRGEGFWVYLYNAASNVALSGEVPASAVGTNKVDLIPGFQMISYAFPQEMAIADCGLVPHDSDYIFKFLNGGYVNYQYIDGIGWLDDNSEPVNITFKPNEGFWYLSYASGTNTWLQTKTYPWP